MADRFHAFLNSIDAIRSGKKTFFIDISMSAPETSIYAEGKTLSFAISDIDKAIDELEMRGMIDAACIEEIDDGEIAWSTHERMLFFDLDDIAPENGWSLDNVEDGIAGIQKTVIEKTISSADGKWMTDSGCDVIAEISIDSDEKFQYMLARFGLDLIEMMKAANDSNRERIDALNMQIKAYDDLIESMPPEAKLLMESL